MGSASPSPRRRKPTPSPKGVDRHTVFGYCMSVQSLLGGAAMVTYDLFAQDSQETFPTLDPQRPRRSAKSAEPRLATRAGAIAAGTHYRRAMAAAKRIRRARHRDVVGRQICEHLRCMLGAEEGGVRGASL